MQKIRLAGESSFAFHVSEMFPSDFDLLYLNESSILTVEQKKEKNVRMGTSNGTVGSFLTQKSSKQETQLAESFLATIPVQ